MTTRSQDRFSMTMSADDIAAAALATCGGTHYNPTKWRDRQLYLIAASHCQYAAVIDLALVTERDSIKRHLTIRRAGARIVELRWPDVVFPDD
jgi:hypothetical protein